MDDAIIAIALTLLAIIGTTIFHLQVLAVVTRFSAPPGTPEFMFPVC